MLKAGAELGFSPSSRTRVQVDKGLNSPFAWLRERNNDPDDLIAKPWAYEPDEFFGKRGLPECAMSCPPLAPSSRSTGLRRRTLRWRERVAEHRRLG